MARIVRPLLPPLEELLDQPDLLSAALATIQRMNGGKLPDEGPFPIQCALARLALWRIVNDEEDP